MEQGESKARRIAGKFYAQCTKTGQRVVRCVVTGKPNPDWHHLDEQKPRYHHYVNIIPLNRQLNGDIDTRAFRPLPTDLTWQALDCKAKGHFDEADYAQAYGCSRLGAFLYRPSNLSGSSRNRSLEFCANALLNLRPKSAVSLAVDTIRRSVLPLLEDEPSPQPVSGLIKARLAMEIGAYFCDYDQATRALECCDIAEKLLDDCGPGKDEKLLTRIYQRRYIVFASLRRFKIAALWSQNVREREDISGYPEGTPNDLLWRANIHVAREKPDLEHATDHIRKLYQMEKKGSVTAWTMAEALWIDADANLIRRRKRKALEFADRAIKCFSYAGIVPTAVLQPKSLEKYYEQYPPDPELYLAPRKPGDLIEFGAVATRALRRITD